MVVRNALVRRRHRLYRLHMPRRAAPLFLAILLVAAVGLPARATVRPSLELVAPDDDIVLYRYGRRVPLSLGLHVASMGAPFELRALRPDYAQPQVLTQVLHGPAGETVVEELDPSFLDGWNGLAGFLEVTFADAAGGVVATKSVRFCPGGFTRERVDDSGPAEPTYPSGCFANPFTKGVVWGIDQSWSVGLDDFEAPRLKIADGEYDVTVAIAARYVEAFGIDPSKASARLRVSVESAAEPGCPGGCKPRPPAPHAHRGLAVPVIAPPAATALPDLVALPSWGVNVENRRSGRSRLSFGATVWAAGASDLVVEGFRRPGEAVMDAYQYFFEGDEAVGKAPVGELEFDDRDGHDHWHFRQFAAYSLLDSGGVEVRESRKEAFCLAPTDAIDLTLPGAAWNPSVGLGTACGSPSSIWVRETLPLGWGDTYFQSLPGQSFDVTDLPNGTYFIRVEANPGGLLHEQTATNNVELREIVVTGKPGHRGVEVPPWNGIDSESGLPFRF